MRLGTQRLLVIVAALLMAGTSVAYLGVERGIFGNTSSSVAGVENQIPPYVKEGYANISIPYPPMPENPENRTITGRVYNRTITAATEINNGSGYLNFTVEVVSGYDAQGIVNIKIDVFANSRLPSALKPTGFRFEAIRLNRSSNYHIDFLHSSDGGVNVTKATIYYPTSNNSCFNVQRNDFSAESELIWDFEGREKPHTLRLNAVILGLSKEVRASIDISMKGGEEL